MYRQIGNSGYRNGLTELAHDSVTLTQSGQLDALVALARVLRDNMLRDLANAHGHTLLLGRMTASERVASFLLEMFERRDRTKALDVPMPRNDIADYLGLTIETVCRILSLFKRDGVIAI